jgi:hypothetical protein
MSEQDAEKLPKVIRIFHLGATPVDCIPDLRRRSDSNCYEQTRERMLAYIIASSVGKLDFCPTGDASFRSGAAAIAVA